MSIIGKLINKFRDMEKQINNNNGYEKGYCDGINDAIVIITDEYNRQFDLLKETNETKERVELDIIKGN